MPPRRFKANHRGGAGDKHVASVADVQARNKGELSAYDKARANRSKKPSDPAAGEQDESEEEESEEEQQEEEKKVEKKSGGYPSALAGMETANPNAVKHNVDKEGVELTRKQREELEKHAARRRYEELHKAGKTDEAKADLARLEEVKRRRDEAAKKRAEEEAKAKVETVDAKAIGRAALTKELKEVMGTEGERVRGSKKKGKEEKDDDEPAPAKGESSKKDEKADEGKKPEEQKADAPKKKTLNGVDVENVYSFVSGADKVKEQGSRFKETDGTIEACRAAEADFM